MGQTMTPMSNNDSGAEKPTDQADSLDVEALKQGDHVEVAGYDEEWNEAVVVRVSDERAGEYEYDGQSLAARYRDVDVDEYVVEVRFINGVSLGGEPVSYTTTKYGYPESRVRRLLVTDGGLVVDSGQLEVETKLVRVHDREGGQYHYLLLQRFDGEGTMLAREGWRGEYVRYGLVSRGDEIAATGDAFGFVRRAGIRDTPAAHLAKDLDTGQIDWADLQDGMQLEPEHIEQLRGGAAE